MIIYGYEKCNNIASDDNEERLLCLEEATIKCSLKEIDTLIDFFTDVKQSLENIDNYTSSHSHFRDFYDEFNEEEESDFIILVVNED